MALQDKSNYTMFTLNCKGRLLIIDSPIVMGIINITPDSFYSNSRQLNLHAAVLKAEQMIEDGATIIDIGGQSTRPGSNIVSAGEEIQRCIPVIESIKKAMPQSFISIDTYYAQVAKAAVEAGADIVNDISSGSMDSNMLKTVAQLHVPYVSMHMQGTPQNMQQNPTYENITREVLDYFIQKTEECRVAGINDIIVDPGFGFGKTIEQNFKLLKELNVLQILQKPLLAGISRKSMIYKLLQSSPEQALNGTTALNTLCLINGAHILRVHDVKEAIETIQLVKQYQA
jgi:dihydropteroate synthase